MIRGLTRRLGISPALFWMTLGLLAAGPTPAHGFDNVDTHPRITRSSVRASALDTTLKNELGVGRGINADLTSKLGQTQTIFDWLQIGSQLEDNPWCTASNHFHNPTKPFPSAGLRDAESILSLVCSSSQRLSSATWGTRFTSPTQRGLATGNPFDWDAARAAYLDALTLAQPSDREAALAETFETLGHVMHLVEDLAVPAHTRNDFQSHLQYCFPRLTSLTRWCENDFERFVRLRPDLVNNALAGPIDFTGQRPTRFWDVDQYDGTNPSADLIQGLTEYTNANFASQYTILTESLDPAEPHFFPYPRASSTNLEALFPHSIVVQQVRAEDSKIDSGLYIKKTTDGEVIEHFAKVAYLWSDVLTFAPGTPRRLFLQLDDVVNADYAALLLPKAIGYSTGLLDYFFRGKLDVDLVNPDANDPTLFQLVGTNGSSDALVDGTLTLYADDPLGVRTQVTSLPPVNLSNVAPGGGISSPSFQPPENAERFVAVYQGTLGLEAKEPGRNFPGGAIGKVLGGVRVEEVFLHQAATAPDTPRRWKLRTPKGVFLLKDGDRALTEVEFERVRWGDGDNILVARTPFGPGQPNRVVAYEVQRVPGSVEPKAVDTPDGPEVILSEKNAAEFPFGMSLGTTVNFSHTIQYRQRLARVDPVRELLEWVPRIPFPPDNGTYEFVGSELGSLAVEAVMAESMHFAESVPVQLDLDHNGVFGSADRTYVWDLQDVAADASGRLLGVVVVSLTWPQSAGTTLPFFGLNHDGGLEVVSQIAFIPSFPQGVNPLLWAVVDLDKRAVVASTAEHVITLTSQAVVDLFPELYIHAFRKFSGGPRPEDQDLKWFKSSFGRVDPSQPAVVDAALETREGVLGVGVTGWLKAELAALGLFDFELGTLERSDVFEYGCEADAALNFFCHAVQVSSSTGLTREPAQLQDARRVRPAPGGERLVFLKVGPDGEGPEDTVLVWDPTTRSARRIHRLPVVAESAHLLGPATGATVMVFAPEGDSVLIPLAGSQPPTLFPGVDLSASFTLLDPSYLYHVGDLKFFRSKPPLQRTALPAKLVDVSGNRVGDYHAIRLP